MSCFQLQRWLEAASQATCCIIPQPEGLGLSLVSKPANGTKHGHSQQDPSPHPAASPAVCSALWAAPALLPALPAISAPTGAIELPVGRLTPGRVHTGTVLCSWAQSLGCMLCLPANGDKYSCKSSPYPCPHPCRSSAFPCPCTPSPYLCPPVPASTRLLSAARAALQPTSSKAQLPAAPPLSQTLSSSTPPSTPSSTNHPDPGSA